MPELPELEALAASLQTTRGRVVAAVVVRSPSVLKTYAPPIDELVGDQLRQVRRRGKWLLLGTRADRTLAIHLHIGGRLRRADAGAKVTRADALVLRFADGADLRLAEIGAKKQSAAHFVDGDGSDLCLTSDRNPWIQSSASSAWRPCWPAVPPRSRPC